MQEDEAAYRRNLESAYGQASKFSDHKPGETIRYRYHESGRTEIRTGIIIWVTPPEELPGGQHIPLCYQVDCSKGIPDSVHINDVLTET